MDNKTFNNKVLTARARQDRILLAKGDDYADGKDRLSNFKAVAGLLGLDQTTVAGVYLLKHVIALCRAIRDRTLTSEPLESRADDVINYVHLLMACFDETDPKLSSDSGTDVILTDTPNDSRPRYIPFQSLQGTKE